MRLKITLVLLLICSLSYGKDKLKHENDDFTQGVDNYKKGNYPLADSLFTLLLNESPGDKNLRYDRGAVRLLLRDTCTFCKDMWYIYHDIKDDEAGKLFYSMCGKADTLYFDKNYNPSDKINHRYYEIKVQSKCFNYTYGEVRDKKNKNNTLIQVPGILFSPRTNIIASYRIYGDTSKIYSFTLSPPIFKNGEIKGDEFDFEHKSPFYLQAMRELKLKRVTAHIQYVVDK